MLKKKSRLQHLKFDYLLFLVFYDSNLKNNGFNHAVQAKQETRVEN